MHCQIPLAWRHERVSDLLRRGIAHHGQGPAACVLGIGRLGPSVLFAAAGSMRSLPALVRFPSQPPL